MTENPFAESYSDPNPYSSPHITPAMGNPLQLPAIILLVLSIQMLIYGIFNAVFGVRMGPPQLDPGVPDAASVEAFMKFGFYSVVIAIPIVNLLTVVGSISMLRYRNRGLAMVDAIAALTPVCGPCFVLGIPFGIWALVVLSKPEVGARFR